MNPLKILSKINQRICSVNSKLYLCYLRKQGIIVGEGTRFFGGQPFIDTTRPCLVEIGKNCMFASGVTLLTHGYDWSVLREKYGEMLSSSGKVVIGNNVFIGTGSIILKGVNIGKNTIIGAGSVVTHDIPDNSVAAGNPCRFIMSIDEYYEKRKVAYIEEAKAYAFEIYNKSRNIPTIEDFWEEFPLFLRRDGNWGTLPVKEQLGSAFESFMKSKPLYKSLEEFLIDAGIPAREIERRKRSSN